MKRFLVLLLFPLLMFSQETTLVGDVDCSGTITSEDASLILQFVASVIEELPCQENMEGLTPNQLEDIMGTLSENITVSNGMPTMITEVYEETMSFALAMSYCRNLQENGYTDWYLPTLDQLLYAGSGGVEFPDQITLDDEELWTISPYSGINLYTVRLTYGSNPNGTSVGTESSTYGNDSFYCRCVR